MKRVFIDGELVQLETFIGFLLDCGQRHPPHLSCCRLEQNLAVHIDPADDAGLGLVTHHLAAQPRPRVKPADEREGADDGGLLGGEVLPVPVLELHLQDRDLGDDLIHQTHLQTNEFIDLLVPGRQSVHHSENLDALLGNGAGVRGGERDPRAAPPPHLLQQALVAVVRAVGAAHERGVAQHREQPLQQRAAGGHRVRAVRHHAGQQPQGEHLGGEAALQPGLGAVLHHGEEELEPGGAAHGRAEPGLQRGRPDEAQRGPAPVLVLGQQQVLRRRHVGALAPELHHLPQDGGHLGHGRHLHGVRVHRHAQREATHQLIARRLQHLARVARHLAAGPLQVRPRPRLVRVGRVGVRVGVAVGHVGGLRQLEVVLALLAHPVAVGAGVVPLDPDPAVLPELPDDPALARPVLVPPLPVLAPHHPAANLQEFSDVRTTQRRHANLRLGHHVLEYCMNALIFRTLLKCVEVVAVVGEVRSNESEQSLHEGHGLAVHHEVELLARVGDGQHAEQRQQEPGAGQRGHAVLVPVVEAFLHPRPARDLAPHPGLGGQHQLPQLRQAPLDDPGVGDGERRLVVAGQHVHHVQALRHAARARPAQLAHDALPPVEQIVLDAGDEAGLLQQLRHVLHTLHPDLVPFHLQEHALAQEVQIHELVVITDKLHYL